ncbi:MAG: amidohydrolase family protein, partial [Chloroflexota bacterium]
MIHGIDMHTHFVPRDFPAYGGTEATCPWPSMAHAGSSANVMINGTNYRTVPDTSWDGAKRIAEMDATGIRRHVVSPMPELLSYWMTPPDGAALIAHVNEEIAALCDAHPDRFSGIGGVPLQDIDLAIRALEDIRATGRLVGVELATHVSGVSIGDPRFEPFFAAAEHLDLPIFVHGLRPAGADRIIGRGLEQVVAFPGDVALAIASMITGGTLAKHPNLKMSFSHGGGAIAVLIARMEQGWITGGPMRDLIPEPPSVYARRLYYDTLVYSAPVLRLVIDTFGIDRVMIGT